MLKQDFLIRKMTENDLEKVMKIEQDSFAMPWSKQSYQSELKNHFATYLVADYEGEIVGYGGIWVVFEEAHITNVAVAEDFRNKKIGKRLMLELENIARKKKATYILLEVRPSNEAAITMYTKLDYIPSGIRKNYYSDNNEDAIIMTKYLY